MYKNNRREFLVKMGLLSAATIVGNRSYGKEANRLSRFSLQPALDSVHIYSTGGLVKQTTLFDNLPAGIQPKNALWLNTGDFIDPNFLDNQSIVSQMNKQDFHVSAIGMNEWELGEEKLLKLARKCEFSLVMSHGHTISKEWDTWIKPYEIINLESRRVGIVALGPAANLVQDKEAWSQTNEWAKRLKKDRNCDMIVCLVPQGYKKSFVIDCIEESEALDMMLCGSLREMKASNRIMKNLNNRDTILVVGSEDGRTIGKQVFNMQTDSILLPQLLTHKGLKNSRNV